MRQLRSLAARHTRVGISGAVIAIDQHSQLDALQGIAANAGDRNLSRPGRPSRRQIFRQSLAEALVAGISGGALASPLSFGLVKLMSGIMEGLDRFRWALNGCAGRGLVPVLPQA